MATTRTQRAYQGVSEEGILTVNIYSPERDAKGKQEVVIKRVYDATKLPPAMSNICLAKGLGFYAAARYSSDAGDDLTPEMVAAECDNLYQDMLEGKFTPGRASGEARPTAFFEALAEYLKMPVHVVVQQIRDDKVKFSAGQLAKMAKWPAIAVLTARIERERAAEKEKRAKAGLKGAEDMDILGLFTPPAADEAEEAAAD